MDVDRALVDGGVGGRAVHRADDDARVGLHDRNLGRPVATQGGQVLGPPGQVDVPEPARGPTPQRAPALQLAQQGVVGQAEQGQVRGPQGSLGGGGAQVGREHVGVGRVEDRGLRGGEDRLGVVHQVGVQRVVGGDEDGEAAGPGASGPARLLPQRDARARPAGDEDRVQSGDVDAQLQGVGGGQGPQPARTKVGLQGSALLGQVAAAVGRHRADELGQGEPQRVTGPLGHDLRRATRAHEHQRPGAHAQQIHEQLGGLDDGAASRRGVLARVARVRFGAAGWGVAVCDWRPAVGGSSGFSAGPRRRLCFWHMLQGWRDAGGGEALAVGCGTRGPGRVGARGFRGRRNALAGGRQHPGVAQRRLPQGQGALPGGCGVVGDGHDVVGLDADEAGRGEGRLGRRRRGAQDDWLRAARVQARHEPQEATQHEGDVRPQDPAVGVALVDDDVAQAPQETGPALVARQQGEVEEVGVGQDDVGMGTHPVSLGQGGVAVAGAGAHRAQGARGGAGLALDCLELADEPAQRGGLVGGERLGGG